VTNQLPLRVVIVGQPLWRHGPGVAAVNGGRGIGAQTSRRRGLTMCGIVGMRRFDGPTPDAAIPRDRRQAAAEGGTSGSFPPSHSVKWIRAVLGQLLLGEVKGIGGRVPAWRSGIKSDPSR
jgi:hypothetical protein